jgi:LysM repeat protein
MKRELVLGFCLLCLLRLPAPGQEAAATNAPVTAASNAAAVAEQQGVDEKFKRIAADIESLRAAHQILLDKLSALDGELHQIRAEQARLSANAIGRDDLKPLAQKIEEVDKRRQEDKEAISGDIKKLAAHLEKLLTAAVAEPSPKSSIKPPPAGDGAATESTNTYTVKAGDNFDSIKNACNTDFRSQGKKTITLKQIMAANPGVDPTQLKIGQRILIPLPPE